MRIRSIEQAIHCDEELYSGGARIVPSDTFKQYDFKIKQVLEAIVCAEKRQITIDNLARNGVNFN